jgi:hypothetical protein
VLARAGVGGERAQLQNETNEELHAGANASGSTSIIFAMVGILVHGDNHFIVRGPLPDPEITLELVRHWSIIQIGATAPPVLERWQIVTREFRENLECAVVIPGDGDVSSDVKQLLDELSERGITIHYYASRPG